MRPSAGRHRKWARHGGVEKTLAKVRKGAAAGVETKALFFSPGVLFLFFGLILPFISPKMMTHFVDFVHRVMKT